MRNTRDIKAEILALVKEQDQSSSSLQALGYTRNQINRNMVALVEEGAVFRKGYAKNTFYTVDPDKSDEVKNKYAAPELPELPPIMLSWLGYTNIVPQGAYMVDFE